MLFIAVLLHLFLCMIRVGDAKGDLVGLVIRIHLYIGFGGQAQASACVASLVSH